MFENIVCHRGFHNPDLDLSRPIENSLSAYETAWKYFDLCECDITISKDGHLFLCHDDSYARVAVNNEENLPLVSTPVYDLTSEQVLSLMLLDGTKPTMLVEVLELAKKLSNFTQNGAAGSKKKLVIEIKNSRASSELMDNLYQFLSKRIDLLDYIAVIMSFDLSLMSKLSDWRRDQHQRILFQNIKFMLLTEAPEHYLEENHTVCVDVSQPQFFGSCSSLILEHNLDGVYLEFQKEMTKSPLSIPEESIQKGLENLCQQISVGIWNYFDEQPDGLKTHEIFDKMGIQFLNSDLPDDEMISLGLLGPRIEENDCFDAFWLFCYYGR